MWGVISAITTMVGSVVSAVVLIVSVYQLKKQNDRQNELDKRQKKIEGREIYQIELNIKQLLFERRLSGWNILGELLESIELMKHSSGSIERNPVLIYTDLTNNGYLEVIQRSLGTIDKKDRKWCTDPIVQNNFLKKVSEMVMFSKEISLIFSGSESEILKEFVYLYQDMLRELRKYNILVDKVVQEAVIENKSFDEMCESFKLEEKEEMLVTQFKLLENIHKEIYEKNLMNKLYNQMKFIK